MTQPAPSTYAPEPNAQAARPLVILGAGGLGREILVLITQLNAAGAGWDVRGFYDDCAPATPTVAGFPYLGTSTDLNATPELLAVAVAVGSSAARAALVSQLTSPHLSFPALVHPGVALAPAQRITLGAGCLIQQGCILTCDITLGCFVLLNLGCTLGHDVVLEDFCSLMPHANVGGGAHVGARSYLGTNATLLHQVRVGADAIVGAGAVVVREVPAGTTVVGVPARAISSYQSSIIKGP